MNEIEIDITITMGETCSNTMSLAEARALYGSLKGIIEPEGVRVSGSVGQKTAKQRPKATGEILYDNAEKLMESAMMANEEVVVTKSPEPVAPPTVPKAQTMPPPNLKVEAARERAAARTRGCGQR